MKHPILFEDTVSHYNKWVQGIASRDLASQKIGFKDIVRKNETHLDQNPNLSKAEPTMPHPIPNAVSVLGDLITQTSNAINLFRQSLRNPVLQNNKKAKAEISVILQELKLSMKVLNRLISKLQGAVE